MREIIKRPFYPILFSVFPVLYLAGNNLNLIRPYELIRPVILGLVMAVLLLVYFRLVFKEWHRSALLTTFILILFFTFGHVTNILSQVEENQLLVIWVGFFLAGVYLIVRSKQAKKLVIPMNVVMIIINGITLLPFARYLLWDLQVKASGQSSRELLAEIRNEKSAEKNAITPSDPPDIYYIILDSYEGSSGLQRYYQFDNAPFLNELRTRGFYVADQSRSNYLTTMYSLASNVNLSYINDLPHDLFIDMITSLEINHVSDFLRGHGYQIVNLPSGYTLTDKLTADLTVGDRYKIESETLSSGSISQFEVMFLQTTLARLITDRYVSTGDDQDVIHSRDIINQEFFARRALIENVFINISGFTDDGRANYVFAHLVLPHNPYLYDASGNSYTYNGRKELLGDKSDSPRNIMLYTDQLLYTNKRILEVIDAIMEKSDRKPIMIIQADHGHDTFFDFEHPTAEGVDLRSSILNAFYFPDGDYSHLYPTITPVNTFRIVFNQYFGCSYSILPDYTYIHPRRTANSFGSAQEFELIDPYLKSLK